MQTQLVHNLLADLLQIMRFLRLYSWHVFLRLNTSMAVQSLKLFVQRNFTPTIYGLSVKLT